MRKVTQEEFIERSVNIWGDRWSYEKTVFEKIGNKITVTCKIHGDFTQFPQSHLRGAVGCSYCSGQRPINTEEFIKRAEEKFGVGRFDYSEVNLKEGGIHQKTTIICINHNLPFTMNAWSFLKGSVGCIKCNKAAPISKEKLLRKSAKVFPNKKYDYSEVDFSLGVKQLVSIGCPNENHGFFKQTIDGHLSGREGCPKCAKENRLMSIEDFIEKSKKVWGENKYCYDGAFLTRTLNERPTVTLNCLKHGPFTYQLNSHLNGFEGCLECRKIFGPSKAEVELREFIKGLGLEVLANDREILEGKEIDVFIPALKIGFEYNGLYYHSEDFTEKDTHYQKFVLAQEKGVKLYQIWEDDWAKRKDIIKRHIAHILNKSEQKRIYARKTIVKEITPNIARDFLNDNHIQGFVPATIYLGLYFEEKLVAVANFLKMKEDFVLVRYATSEIVVGGHSKLVKYFEKTFKEFRNLITFADLTFSDGGLYEKTGWIKDRLLPPDYCYFYGAERKHKFGFRKNRFRADPDLVFEEGLSEKELAELNNIPRIWDAGKIRFIRPQQIE